uniref:Cytochrome P450 n=1 Tax=Brachionus rotundiformis TaxID=96890 RepID=A0A5J6KEU9_9BILA|nr:cytochrome P450 [Brachionus rotundiformis]
MLNFIDSNFWLKFTIITFPTLVTFYLIKIWNSYQFFKKRGIKTPEYRFFWGNNLELTKNSNYSDVIRNWTKKYGKTYGYYEGHQPIFVTSDLDVIQEVFLKQSSNFAGRKKQIFTRNDNAPDHMLFTASRSRWKIMRNIMNPTFSSAKLKELGPLLIKCTDRMTQTMENNTEIEIDISEFFKRFTMDSIWNCAFGIDVDIQNKTENKYYDHCEEMFSFLAKPKFLDFTLSYLHEFHPFVVEGLVLLQKAMSTLYDFSRINPTLWFVSHIFEIVELRKKQNLRKKDYLQLLLDVESDSQDKNVDDYIGTRLNKKLTLLEIKMNLMLFMFAGYETTSSTLTYASFVLANNYQEQQKLYQLIRSEFNSENEINPESVQKIEYLDWFIKEVLRMYPIVNAAVGRRCTKSTNVLGIDIPEDTIFLVDVMSLHFDAELWGPVDPNKFYPARHETKRNPLAFMAFGNGPRNCIGMKFAMLELKIALCKLLLHVEIFPTENTPEKLELTEYFVRRPKDAFKILLNKRRSETIFSN